TPR
ncbi:substrate binding domain of ABC-type glycine betaine transport system family protein, partial [Vibrio parahaemolyticus V-223/04]